MNMDLTPEEKYAQQIAEELSRDEVISGPNFIFTRADLSEALDSLTGPDWKGPIDKIIPRTRLLICQIACEYFTATSLNVFEVDDEFVRVTSPGYRAGPAGDH